MLTTVYITRTKSLSTLSRQALRRRRIRLAVHLYNTAKWSTYQQPQRHPFFLFCLKMSKRNIGIEFSCGGLFHLPITVSLHGKGHMYWGVFPFSNYWIATRKRKHGSHECFLLLSMFYMKNTKSKHGRLTQIPFMLPHNYSLEYEQRIVWFFICFSNWMTPNEKTKDRIYRRFCFFVSFFTLRIERNKSMFNGTYFCFPFLLMN